MFQSVWNVAAAFCLHKSEVNEVTISHFGHHFDEHEDHISKEKSQSTFKFLQYLDQMSDDDHSDHLPSLAHVYLSEHDAEINLKVSILSIEDKYLDWNSLYQSPHLYLPKLPPIVTPL